MNKETLQKSKDLLPDLLLLTIFAIMPISCIFYPTSIFCVLLTILFIFIYSIKIFPLLREKFSLLLLLITLIILFYVVYELLCSFCQSVYFLYYAWIRISSVIVYALWIIIIIVGVVFIGWYKLNRLRNRFLEPIIPLLLLVSITLLTFCILYLSILYLYPKYIEEVRTRYGTYCSMDIALAVTLEYKNNFHNTYDKPFFKPQLYKLKMLMPEELLDRLEAIVRTGACGDFARGLAKLLEDSLEYEVRRVSFKTIDHTFPEVKISGIWYVFDFTYTTPDKPVKASNYAEYLYEQCMIKKKFCEVYNASFNGLIDATTGEDLRANHGILIKN